MIGDDVVGALCLNPTNIARWLTNASGRHERLRPKRNVCCISISLEFGWSSHRVKMLKLPLLVCRQRRV